MNFAARAAGWSARHPGRAIIAWLAFVVVAVMIGQSAKMNTLSPVDAGNGQSQQADRLIQRHFPQYASEQVLVQGRGATKVSDPAFAAAVNDVVRRLRKTAYVAEVTSPFAGGNRLISRDGRSALVTFKVLGDDKQAKDRVSAALAATAAAQRGHPGMRIEEVGDASVNRAVSKALERDFRKAEVTSVPLTLLILLVAFGSLVAAGVPVLLGLTAVLATLGLLAPFSHAMPLEEMVSNVVLLIGLAVGVDYSMFYVRRKLEERRAGRSNSEALSVAAATSGRAILVSGFTVMIAMAGMLFAGNAVFRSFGIGTVMVVAVALLGSVSVLPAVLAKLGDRIEAGRVPFIGRARTRAGGEPRAWSWFIDRVLRHPAIALTLGVGLLVALALPALGMRTVTPGISAIPQDQQVVHTYNRVQAAFPGGSEPARIVVKAPDVTAPAVKHATDMMTLRALFSGMSAPVTHSISADRRIDVVSIAIPGNGTDSRSVAAVEKLRNEVIPATIGPTPAATAYVTGQTAQSKDFGDVMDARLPFVFAFVLGLAFVLLLVSFRSIVIPLSAIALNLLSVGAAYGAVTLVFQHGRFESALGYQSIGGVITWLPLFLFVILFGLSMDYHVLILSRIKEGVEDGLSTEDAVAHGLKTTAGVITSAAVVMVAVFAVFGTLGFIAFKMFGLALAFAVLVDATIVRAVLVPALMKLLGKWNWYLPKGLRPRLGGGPGAERPQRPAPLHG